MAALKEYKGTVENVTRKEIAELEAKFSHRTVEFQLIKNFFDEKLESCEIDIVNETFNARKECIWCLYFLAMHKP